MWVLTVLVSWVVILLKQCFSILTCLQATQNSPSSAVGLYVMNSSLLTNTLDFVTFCDLSEQARHSPVPADHLPKTPVLQLQQLLYLGCFSCIIPGGVLCYRTINGRRSSCTVTRHFCVDTPDTEGLRLIFSRLKFRLPNDRVFWHRNNH